MSPTLLRALESKPPRSSSSSEKSLNGVKARTGRKEDSGMSSSESESEVIGSAALVGDDVSII